MQAQWSDPQFAGRSLRGEKVLVVCDAKEAALKRLCEDQVGAQITAMGATPITANNDDGSLIGGSGAANDKALAAARDAGAKAVLTSAVAPDATVVKPGPSIGFGLGSFGGGWNSGTSVGGGVGVSVPVGKANTITAYAANMVLTDVPSGKLMWTGKVTTPASQDLNDQMTKLAKNGVQAVQKAGLL